MKARIFFQMVFVVLLCAAVGVVSLSFGGTAHAAATYTDTLSACPEGFLWRTVITFTTPGYDLVIIVSSSPPSSGGFGPVVEAFGVGTFEGTMRGKWNTPQLVGSTVTVTATADRPGPVTITLSAVVRDDGCPPPPEFGFQPGDDRVDPRPGDRLAIYCDARFRDIDVWGIRDDGSGYRLAAFEFDELTFALPRTVRRDLGPNGVLTAGIDRVENIFFVSWVGGPYGATGVGDWQKAFRCPFEWVRNPTPTPEPRGSGSGRVNFPVITLTPSPTPSPLPTRPRF
jgi:hypothetical protein